MKLLSPDLLKALIRNDRSVQRAHALLANDWPRIFSQPVPLNQRQIGARDVRIAFQLAATGLVRTKLNFKNYQEVHGFIVNHGNYLTAAARRQLLRPFRE